MPQGTADHEQTPDLLQAAGARGQALHASRFRDFCRKGCLLKAKNKSKTTPTKDSKGLDISPTSLLLPNAWHSHFRLTFLSHLYAPGSSHL